ncbi:MAG: DUF4097 family beta strand repeat-containing protein [Candidatus Aegiribacteria sp.]|nr:DUF4097 family beta strand repeat-containing protein [Candidatus Aegiribacteria sp.]
MSEEQREILQMVADGKISADDGAQLLEALTKGERKRKEMGSPARRAKEKKRIMHEYRKMGPITGFDGLRDIGRMVRGMVKDSVSGIDDEFMEIDEDMFEDGGHLEGPLELDEGTELVLKRRVRRNGRNNGGDLILNGVSGSTLEVIGENTPDIRLYRDNGTVYLKWEKSDLSLNVPETVENVRASIMGGNIILNSVKGAADIRTMGGDINLSEASRAFRAKTMGGNILIKLTDDWNEDSRVTTMGGNIALSICESTKAEISAKTMGGEITVQEDISGLTESGHPGSSRVNIDLSDEEESPELRLKTMGGNISIDRSGIEPVVEDNGEKKKRRKNRKERK